MKACDCFMQVMGSCFLFSCFSPFSSNIQLRKKPRSFVYSLKFKITFTDIFFVVCLFLDFSMKLGNLDANCGHTWHKHKNNVYSGLLVSCRENSTSRGSTFGRSLLVPSPDLPLRPHFSPPWWLACPQVSCSNTRAHLQSNSLQLLPG